VTAEAGKLVFAGCRDGVIRSYDTRLKPADGMVGCFHHHQSSIVKVHLPLSSPTILYSGGNNGDVFVSDIRFAKKSIQQLNLVGHKSQGASLDAMAGHHYAPIIAAGSHKSIIEVVDTNGVQVDALRYHIGFLGQRIGPISTLAFHQHKLLLAAGAMDSFISIFAGTKEY